MGATMRSIAAVVLSAGCGASALAGAAGELDPIVVTDDLAEIPVFGPGTFSGGSFGSDYGINASGEVMINAGIRWDDPPFFFYVFVLNNGIYVDEPEGPRPLILGGEPVPFGGPDERFFVADAQTWNDSGSSVVAVAGVAPVGPFGFEGRSRFLVRVDSAGQTEILATRLESSLSPELPIGTSYQSFGMLNADGLFGDARLNNADDVIYVATLAGNMVDSLNNEVLLANSDGVAELLIREGSAAPSLGAGVFIGSEVGRAFNEPKLNDLGQTFLRVRLVGPGVASGFDQAIYSFADDGVELVAASTGENATGDEIRSLRDPETNEQGRVVFRGTVGPVNDFDQALFEGDASDVGVVLRTGDAAPGLDGLTIETLIADESGDLVLPIAQPILSENGAVVFTADLAGPGITPFTTNKRTLFYGEPGSFVPVLRTGGEAPGVPGAEFVSIGEFAVNAPGEVVFRALLLRGTDVLTSLWAWDEANGLRLVARSGEQLPLRNGDTARSTIVNFRGGPGQQSGFSSQLNDDGTVMFDVNLQDNGSGDEVFAVYRTNIRVQPDCPADVTGDGQVDLADLNLVLAQFGQASGSGDTNDDGQVNLADLNEVLGAFGSGCG